MNDGLLLSVRQLVCCRQQQGKGKFSRRV